MKKLKEKMVFLAAQEVLTKGNAMHAACCCRINWDPFVKLLHLSHAPQLLVRIRTPLLGSASVGTAFSQCLTNMGVHEASPLV